MDIPALLHQTRLFSSLPQRALRELEKIGAVCGYPGGSSVYELGSPADHLYVVLTGRLRAVDGAGRLAVEVGRLETIGEIGFISGASRSTHVFAARDSLVLQLDRERLLPFLHRHPEVMFKLSQSVVKRLTQSHRSSALDAAQRPRSFAVLPATPDTDHREVARLLQLAISGNPLRQVLDAHAVDQILGAGTAQSEHSEAQGQVSSFLADREAATRHLFLVSDSSASTWTRRCLRQVDRILLVVDMRHAATLTPMLQALQQTSSRAPVDLIVLRGPGDALSRVHQWKALSRAAGHYFLDPAQDGDAHRIGRSLSGRAIGLVLGGGGARGFAHLGLLRALDELGIPIDVIGGSSMGAFIGALRATGHSPAQALALTHQTFVQRNLLNDYLLPRIALIRGRKFMLQMESLFGEQLIEELPLPYFCVSTNLSRGRPEVHDDGRLSTWVATSMAVPGIAPPVAWRGDLLCDGAVVNALPTDVMAGLNRGLIVASDVSTEGAIGAPGVEGPDPEAVLRPYNRRELADTTGKKATMLSILFRTATLTNESGIGARAAGADLYMRMPVSHVGMFEWKKLQECERIGYLHALKVLGNAKPFLLAPALGGD